MRSTFNSKVLFILMNSFSTSADTREFLAKSHSDLLAEPHIELMQNMSPKVDAATLLPASYPAQPDLEWWVCGVHRMCRSSLTAMCCMHIAGSSVSSSCCVTLFTCM